MKPDCGDDLHNYINLLSFIELYTLNKWIFICKLSFNAAATAKSLQSCLTLCDPIDGSPPGSVVPGILQARTLELGAIAFSHPSIKPLKY